MMRHDHGSYCKRCGKLKMAAGQLMKAWTYCAECRSIEHPAPAKPPELPRYPNGRRWLEMTFGRR